MTSLRLTHEQTSNKQPAYAGWVCVGSIFVRIPAGKDNRTRPPGG